MLAQGELISGKYRVEGLLGEGGMARVYRARHVGMGREVALKIIPDLGSLSGAAVARFQREIKVHSNLNHQNLVKIFDGGVHAGRPYLVLELIRGQTLQETLRSRGPLPIDEVSGLARGLIEALGYLHSRGTVHRDIKSSNVMVNGQNEAILMDFGLACAEDSTILTEAGMVLGTVPYLPPEVIQGEAAGPPGDVRAWGLMVHAMLTGELPYRADTPAGWAGAITAFRPTSLRAVRPDLPPWIDELVTGSLVPGPKDRPTAAAIAAIFRRGGAPVDPAMRVPTSEADETLAPVADRTMSAYFPRAGARWRQGSRNALAWIAGLTIGLLAIGSGWLLGARHAVVSVPPGGIPPRPPTIPSPGFDFVAATEKVRGLVKVCVAHLARQSAAFDAEVGGALSFVGTRSVYSGDPGPLFRALVALNETIEGADRAAYDGPGWIDLGECVRPLIVIVDYAEPALKRGSLAAPLRRLESHCREGSGRYRACFGRLLDTMVEGAAPGSGEVVANRADVHLALFESFEALPAAWKSSGRGLHARIDALRGAGRPWDQIAYRSVVLSPGAVDPDTLVKVGRHLVAFLPDLLSIRPSAFEDWDNQVIFAFLTAVEFSITQPLDDPDARAMMKALPGLWDILCGSVLKTEKRDALSRAVTRLEQGRPGVIILTPCLPVTPETPDHAGR